MRKVHRLKDASTYLDPIRDNLVNVIKGGFNDWLQIRDFANSLDGGVVEYKPRTKAGVIHEHIKKYAKSEFLDNNNIIVDEFNGVFGINVKEEIFIRFKKMDREFSVNNLNTKQHKKYMGQAQIEGFPSSPTFLFAGYIPDKTWSSIKGVYIACWVNDTLEWVDEFGKYSSEQSVFDFEKKEADLYKEIEKRVKIKTRQDSDKKTGTDN